MGILEVFEELFGTAREQGNMDDSADSASADYGRDRNYPIQRENDD